MSFKKRNHKPNIDKSLDCFLEAVEKYQEKENEKNMEEGIGSTIGSWFKKISQDILNDGEMKIIQAQFNKKDLDSESVQKLLAMYAAAQLSNDEKKKEELLKMIEGLADMKDAMRTKRDMRGWGPGDRPEVDRALDY